MKEEIRIIPPQQIFKKTYPYSKDVMKYETRSVATIDKSGIVDPEMLSRASLKAYVACAGFTAPIFEAAQYAIARAVEGLDNHKMTQQQFEQRITLPSGKNKGDVYMTITLSKPQFEDYALDGLPYKTDLWNKVDKCKPGGREQLLPIVGASGAYIMGAPITAERIRYPEQLQQKERKYFEEMAKRLLENPNATQEQIEWAQNILTRHTKETTLGIIIKIYYPLIRNLLETKDGKNWTQIQKAFYYNLHDIAYKQRVLRFSFYENQRQKDAILTLPAGKSKTGVETVGTLSSLRKIIEYLFIHYNDAPKININAIDMWEHVNPSEIDYRPVARGQKPRLKNSWQKTFNALNMAVILLNNMEQAGGQFPFAPTNVGWYDQKTNITSINVIPHVKCEPVLNKKGEPVLNKEGKPKQEKKTVIFNKNTVPMINTQPQFVEIAEKNHLLLGQS